jgi:pectin methylesterase-like acyl-CoA thioesterase
MLNIVCHSKEFIDYIFLKIKLNLYINMSFNPIQPKPPTIPQSINSSTIKSSTIKSENIFSKSINMNGGRISDLGDPVAETDAANKQYVKNHKVILTGPISSDGEVTSITSQSGTGTTFAMNTSPYITDLDVGGTIIKNVGNPVNNTDATNKNYVDLIAGSDIEFLAIVQKNPAPNEFSTIESALASITTASVTEPWTISVGPGVYSENQLVMKPYVNVQGSAIGSTIISPKVANQYLFIMANNTELSFLSLQGISGAGGGYSAVYCKDVGDFAQIFKVSIYDFDVGIHNFADTTSSIVYVEYTDVNGNYSYGTINKATASFEASCVLQDYFSFPSTLTNVTAVLNDGINAKLVMSGSSLTGGVGMTGIVAMNGGELLLGSVIISDFPEGGLISLNMGAGANIKIDGVTFDNCIPDFSIENVGTTGYFFGNSPRNNHSIINTSTFFMAGRDSNIINVAKRGGDYTSIKQAVDAAIISGASPSNIYLVKIGPGVFKELDTITLNPGIFLFGYYLNATTIVAPSVSSTVIVASDFAYIRDVFVTGATSGIGISFTGNLGIGTLIRDCGFGDNQTNINVFGGDDTQTLIVVDRCSILGDYTECFVVTNNPGNTTTRITIDNLFYRDLVTPVSTNFLRASGVGVSVNVVSTLLLVAQVDNSKAFFINDGVNLRITGSSITGFDSAIYVPVGSPAACTINGAGVLINDSKSYDIFIGDPNTVGAWVGEVIYSKTSIPTDSSFYISGKDETIITVQKKGGDFTSIVDALDSIIDNTTSNRFVIRVGSGVYAESEIIMKEYVNIYGNGKATVVAPDSNNHHIIRGIINTEIGDMILSGSGPGYAAIYQESSSGSSEDALICRNILFGENDIHCWAYGDVGEARVILFDSKYGGTYQFNYGFRTTNNSATNKKSSITLMGITSQDFTLPLPKYVLYSSGVNCEIIANGFIAIYEGTPPGSGSVVAKTLNGGHISLIGADIEGFDMAIYSENAGSAPSIVSSGSSILDCTVDINIAHPSTTGSINICASRVKTTVNGTPPMTLFLVDPEDSGIVSNGPFFYSRTTYNTVTDISNLISKTPTMGVISGGSLTKSSPNSLVLIIGAGTGYTNLTNLVYNEWSAGTIELPQNSTVYIFLTTNNIISSNAAFPNSDINIILGQVSTNATSIIYIQNTPLNSVHWSNHMSNMVRQALGPIYVSGSQVSESTIQLQLMVTQGVYYYSTNEFNPGGSDPITFTVYYRSGVSGTYTAIIGQTSVPTDFYDDGTGFLATLPDTKYTKHLLCLLGGPEESYALIYSQNYYDSDTLAVAGGLPLLPSFITSAFVKVVSIIVQEGTVGIISFVDERPRIGFASSSTTGTITVHGDLIGLGADDHPQYLLTTGGTMTGDLNLGESNIVNPGLYDGFDVSDHALRHAFGAVDGLSPALDENIMDISDSVASAGSNNALIPRADHVHAHGNRGGGSLHVDVIAAGASGFMTGDDKTKLDGIVAGATNTTLADEAPANTTKSDAVVGGSLKVAREDHKHDIFTAVASGLSAATLNSEGIASSLARSDHTHAIPSDIPSTQIPGQANVEGNSNSFARSDHIHEIPTAKAASLDANSSSTEGAATTFSRSNHSHSIASGLPSNQTISATLVTGGSANFARADHLHTFSTDAPVTIGDENVIGTSTSFARADHVHDHGVHTDPTDHAVATTSTSGFMSSSDKTKLDNVATSHVEVSTDSAQTFLTVSTPIQINGMSVTPNVGTHIVNFNANYSSVASTITAQAKIDLLTMYSSIDNLTATVTINAAKEFANDILLAGVYQINGALTTAASSTLTLNGAGVPNALFVIRCTGTFASGANSTVSLIGGTKSSNVFWLSTGALTLGVNTTISGNLCSRAAVNPAADCTMNGRLLTVAGAIGILGNSTLTKQSDVSSIIPLGIIESFAIFTSSGAVTGVSDSIVIGDIGTNLGSITGFVLANVTGNFYTQLSILSKLTFGIYKGGVLVAYSSREITSTLINNNKSVISLFALVPTTTTGEVIDVRVVVESGTLTVNNRIISALQIAN